MKLTPEQEQKLLEQADALAEMTKTNGWKALEGMIQQALAVIATSKARISTSEWKQDAKGQAVEVRKLTLEEIGHKYITLHERETAFKSILGEVEGAIKRGRKLREGQAKQAEKKD